jgi:transposase
MSQINRIRNLYGEGWSVAKISRELEIDEKTTRKYLALEDFSPKAPEKPTRPSRLDQFKTTIDSWLEEDTKRWYKQRHTAKRIHERLKQEMSDFYCSYNTVQRYVKEKKQYLGGQRGNQELVWHPGESQADFGEADFIEQGEMVRKKYFTLSFPQSNNSFTQVFGGETGECVCQGLKDIFEYIGGVPTTIVFDNATGVGRRMGEVIHEAKLFEQMRAHYRFSVRFCNPDAGHEKGNVENKIGYTRRNLFVPVPSFDDVIEYNRRLLDRHEEKAEEIHYKKLQPIKELFKADKKALLPLPSHPFDACRYEYLKTDGYGKVRIDGRHFYSSSPEYAGQEVLVAIRAHTIDILDSDHKLIVSHPRSFGSKRSDSLDYRTSLAMLMRNPGAWKNSGVRELVPSSVKDLMDSQPREELSSTLRTLNHLSVTYSFETALRALEEGIRIHKTDFHAAAVLAARIHGYGLDTAPTSGPDLKSYDSFLAEEVSLS